MGGMGGGWWDSFRREMLKRRWIGDQSFRKDSDSSDSSEVPEVPEVNSRLPFYCAFACSRNKCPAQASVPPSFPRNINFVWRAHQKSMLSQLKWGINLKGYKICISLDQVN